MADISKASRYIEKDMRFREQDPQVQAERQRVIEALKHGNIHEVFANETKFKIGDFTDFFSSQWKNFKSQIIQDTEIKAGEASFHPPSIDEFPLHHKGADITPEEGELFTNAMMDFATSGTGAGATSGGGKFKAQTVDGTADATSADASVDVETMAQGTLAEWDRFLDDTWGTIFDAQLTQEMQSKMGEVRSEVQRIINMVKSGQLSPEFALIALAKVNSTRNGVLMSGLGKKMYHINEEMSNMSQELYDMSASGDPNYYAQVQLTQSETRDGSYQLNLLTSDMQKVMQDTSSTIESVKGMMDLLVQGRAEIIRKTSL